MPADIWGFLRIPRTDPPRRRVPDRLRDWRVVIEPLPARDIERQATRCMDCGIPFCHAACPTGNLIPDWAGLIEFSQWRRSVELLEATNNFPEFTGWLCPAPCESACVLAIDQDAVTIKQIERTIIEKGWENGWIQPQRPSRPTGKRVAIVGSGPAGLAAAQQLTRAGHEVVVFERDDRFGGLLRYGIPDFKMDKALIDRRLSQMASEGTTFVSGVEVGSNLPARFLLTDFDACVLACGALAPRPVDVPGRDLEGIVWAIDYLEATNRVQAGDLRAPPVDAAGKRVMIIGGGDTGADCLGAANRQGAIEVVQIDHNPPRPLGRDPATNPWPQVPRTRDSSPAHEEGVVAGPALRVEEFVGDEHGRVCGIRLHRVERFFENGQRTFEPVPGGEIELECQLVLIAAGFTGTERGSWLDDLGIEFRSPPEAPVVDDLFATTAEGVYACGDMTRGTSLVVWAIAEGRSCAAAVDRVLEGHTDLHAPVTPSNHPF